jgi:trehalose utilization protein
MNVTIWDECQPGLEEHYPTGIHSVIAGGLRDVLGERVAVRTAVLDEPFHGLPAEVLESTDVLLWWGHLRHGEVDDKVVDEVQRRVLDGMGLLVLHSGQGSKIFRRLLGTTCAMSWRHDDRELVWTVDPGHPIARGVPNPVVIPQQEMYGEPFDIPAPDELVFISSFGGGEVFRSGCCFRRGRGRIFYFSPGHEEQPVYHQPEIQLIIANAVEWACP